MLVGTLAKVNSVPCMCTTLSESGQRVDNWLQCLAYIERIFDAYS